MTSHKSLRERQCRECRIKDVPNEFFECYCSYCDSCPCTYVFICEKCDKDQCIRCIDFDIVFSTYKETSVSDTATFIKICYHCINKELARSLSLSINKNSDNLSEFLKTRIPNNILEKLDSKDFITIYNSLFDSLERYNLMPPCKLCALYGQVCDDEYKKLEKNFNKINQ